MEKDNHLIISALLLAILLVFELTGVGGYLSYTTITVISVLLTLVLLFFAIKIKTLLMKRVFVSMGCLILLYNAFGYYFTKFIFD